MEGEHLLERREEEEEGSDTPQGCLSPDTEIQSDTPTPTPTHGTKTSQNNVDRIREQVRCFNLNAIWMLFEPSKFTDAAKEVGNKSGGWQQSKRSPVSETST